MSFPTDGRYEKVIGNIMHIFTDSSTCSLLETSYYPFCFLGSYEVTSLGKFLLQKNASGKRK